MADNKFAGINEHGHFWAIDIMSGLEGSKGWHTSFYSEKLAESDSSYLNEGLSVRCLFGQAQISIPSLVTAEIIDISKDGAWSGGTITSNGGAYLADMGVCWSILRHPSTDDNTTSDKPGSYNVEGVLHVWSESAVHR